MKRFLFAALALSIGSAAASPAAAQFNFDFGDGELKINVWPACLYDRPGASPASVRENARASGYRRIHNIVLHKKRYNANNQCGFYRAEAYRNGRQFALYFNADSANLINVRRLGPGKPARRLSEADARKALRRDGYRRIRNLRFVDRGRNEFYVARARKGGTVYRVTLNARNGNVVRNKPIKQVRATEAQVRQMLKRRGYDDIANVRFRDRNNDEFWIARASKGGTIWRVFLDAETARPLRRVAIKDDRITQREARLAIRRAGYRRIQNLRQAERRGRAVFVARASRRGGTYRVVVDATDGDLVRARRLK